MQDATNTGEFLLGLALHEGSLLNDGGEEHSNIAAKERTLLDLYAIRDIEEGEEILYDYGLFDTLWHEFYL